MNEKKLLALNIFISAASLGILIVASVKALQAKAQVDALGQNPIFSKGSELLAKLGIFGK